MQEMGAAEYRKLKRRIQGWNPVRYRKFKRRIQGMEPCEIQEI